MPKKPKEAANYFVMTCEGIFPGTSVSRASEWNGPPWMTGERIIGPVPSPFVFRLDQQYPGKMKPMYEGTILLMRDDLLVAMHDAGVDNLQIFPAAIQDEAHDLVYEDYKAVNIVGKISCANMEESELMDPDDENELVDVDFESLVIDEEKAGGALLFRLAEAVNAIIVHVSVRKRIENTIDGMTFYGPGEWSG